MIFGSSAGNFLLEKRMRTAYRNRDAPQTVKEAREAAAIKRGELDPADAETAYGRKQKATTKATGSAVSDEIKKLNERTDASLAKIEAQAESQKALLGDLYTKSQESASALEAQLAESKAKLGELFTSIMDQIAAQGQEADAASEAAKASSDLLQAAQQRARIGDTSSLRYDRTRGQATRTSTLPDFGFMSGSSRRNTFSNA